MQMAAPEAWVKLPSEALDFTSGMNFQAPALSDTSDGISSMSLAWLEWNHGSTITAERVRQIKAEPTLILGRRASSLHKKKRHLPQFSESQVQLGATEDSAVSLLVHIAGSICLSLDLCLSVDQMREGARLLASHTAKRDHQALTAETTGTLERNKAAVQLACQHVISRGSGEAAGPVLHTFET